MPHSLGCVCVETLVVLVVTAVVAQVAVSYWSRFDMKHELKGMKSNLHQIETTVNTIDTTYDNLNKELRTFATKAADIIDTDTTKATNPFGVDMSFPKKQKTTRIMRETEKIMHPSKRAKEAQVFVKKKHRKIGGDVTDNRNKWLVYAHFPKDVSTDTMFPRKSDHAGSGVVLEIFDCNKDKC